jgi:hypothetical protein
MKKKFWKISLRAALTALSGLVAFCLGFVVSMYAYDRWVVPGLVKQYPHDGQIGLALFGAGAEGGLLCAAIALVVGTVWTFEAVRGSKLPPNGNP